MLYDPWSVEAVFGHGLAAVVDSGDVPGGVSSVISLINDEVEIVRVGLGEVSAFEG
jgi:tRNA A37 threonylcarbamoyladenosine synthetase subunit TsaC/SUA5/YrdC